MDNKWNGDIGRIYGVDDGDGGGKSWSVPYYYLNRSLTANFAC